MAFELVLTVSFVNPVASVKLSVNALLLDVPPETPVLSLTLMSKRPKKLNPSVKVIVLASVKLFAIVVVVPFDVVSVNPLLLSLPGGA
jgi:hypothetical protein